MKKSPVFSKEVENGTYTKGGP